MGKDGNRIKRLKSAATETQGAAYLREMAEQGHILEEMNHLWYIFREDAPAYLQYRLETRERVLSEEERAAYAADGWQEVCHYELEYVFAKEIDVFTPAEEIQPEEVVQALDRKIEIERKDMRFQKWSILATVVFVGVAALAVFGFSGEAAGFVGKVFLRYALLLLLVLLLGKRSIRKMQQEKEDVLTGDIPEKYTDWRGNRRTAIALLAVMVVGFCGWLFYECEWNEKTFDLPQTISYAEIPAVRLENLTEETLTRAGESIDPDMEGIRVSADFMEGSMYEIRKEMGGFDNYAVDCRWLLQTEKKLETKQCMQTEDGTELNLDTMYERYRSENTAEKVYLETVLAEERWEEEFDTPKREILSPETDVFDDLHVYRRDWTNEISYYILCRQGNQLMELDYSSKQELDLERMLAEVEQVFAAQREI